MANTLAQDLRKLAKLRRERDELKRRFDAADAKFKEHRTHVFHRMQAEETESMKVAGTLYVAYEDPMATVQDREAFVEWAKDNAPELVQLTERKRVLNELVRERLDNGEPLPPGIGLDVKEKISMRAAS